MKRALKTIDLSKMMQLSFLLFLLPFLFGTVINMFVLQRPLLVFSKVYWDILFVLALFLAGIFLHEGLHGLAALVLGRAKLKDIAFGIHLKQAMLYCHIKKPLSVKVYRIVLILPVLITGVIPFIIAIAFGNILLVFLFSALISGGAGDILMLYSLRKEEKNGQILDHPKAPAYYMCYAEGEEPTGFLEVTEEEEAALNAAMHGTGQGATGKNNSMIKTLLILIFLSVTTLAIFLFGLFMRIL